MLLSVIGRFMVTCLLFSCTIYQKYCVGIRSYGILYYAMGLMNKKLLGSTLEKASHFHLLEINSLLTS